MSSNGYAKISVKRGLKCSNPHETQSTCIFSFSTLPVPTVEKIQIIVLGPFINKILPILTPLLLHRHLANPSPVFLGIFLIPNFHNFLYSVNILRQWFLISFDRLPPSPFLDYFGKWDYPFKVHVIGEWIYFQNPKQYKPILLEILNTYSVQNS